MALRGFVAADPPVTRIRLRQGGEPLGEAEVTGRRPDLADAFADYGRIAVGWQLDCPLPRTPGLLEAEFLDGTGPRGTRTLHPRVAVAAAR